MTRYFLPPFDSVCLYLHSIYPLKNSERPGPSEKLGPTVLEEGQCFGVFLLVLIYQQMYLGSYVQATGPTGAFVLMVPVRKTRYSRVYDFYIVCRTLPDLTFYHPWD